MYLQLKFLTKIYLYHFIITRKSYTNSKHARNQIDQHHGKVFIV